MHYLGVDIVKIARIERAVAVWGERFLERVYTGDELARYRRRVASLASRFAAKEALIKALGGISEGFSWREIEIISNDEGRPRLCLYGSMLARARELGLGHFDVSLSDCEEYAVAFVIAETVGGVKEG
jgi:holo-[acyl-carrier protein] synthase